MSTRVLSAIASIAGNGFPKRKAAKHPATSQKQLASGRPVAAPSSDDVKSRTSGHPVAAPAPSPIPVASAPAAAPKPKSKSKSNPKKTKSKAQPAPQVQPDATGKKRRWRNGTVARRRVKAMRMNTKLMLAKAGISNLVKDCSRLIDSTSGQPIVTGAMSRRARESLHTVVENILSRLAAEAREHAHVCGLESVKPHHLLYVFRKWAVKQPGTFLPTFGQAMHAVNPEKHNGRDEYGFPKFSKGSIQADWNTMLRVAGFKEDLGLGPTKAANPGFGLTVEYEMLE